MPSPLPTPMLDVSLALKRNYSKGFISYSHSKHSCPFSKSFLLLPFLIQIFDFSGTLGIQAIYFFLLPIFLCLFQLFLASRFYLFVPGERKRSLVLSNKRFASSTFSFKFLIWCFYFSSYTHTKLLFLFDFLLESITTSTKSCIVTHS